MENNVTDFNQAAYAVLKKYNVDPEDLQNIAEVNVDCSDFTVIAKITNIFGFVNKISGIEEEGPYCFIRIEDNSEIRMIIKKDELDNIQMGNYYIMTHIDCGIYNNTRKLRTAAHTKFVPISETDARTVVSHFPKKESFRYRNRFRYGDYGYYDYYDPYDGFSEAPDNGLYCRNGDSWDYGNL